jgi:probable F420-dependent oxidoreductase
VIAGVTLGSLGVLGLPAALDVVRSAEAIGYRQAWVAEANGPESFALLGAIGTAAPSLGLGTGVVPIQLRTPALVAMAAATLQALQPDREVLVGLGMSSPVIATRWHGVAMDARPLAAMREYVAVLRACLSGDAVDHDGERHRIKGFRLGVRLGEQRPRIVLAALNPGMLRLAGEVADGVLLNYLPSHHVPALVAEVRAGEASAGRPAGSTTISAYVHACVGEHDAVADAARRDLWSYASADGYRRMFTAAGYGDEMAAFAEATAARDRDAAVAAMSDRMVAEIDTIGSAAEVTAFCRAYVDQGVDVPILMPLPWVERGGDRMAVVEATMAAAIEAWAS